MNKLITRILYHFNKLEPVALIVVVLSIFYLGIQLYFNEEIYFGFSKAYMDPLWIPGTTLFTDFAGTRILFQVIFGFILRFISFEQITIFGRLLGYILLAFPLAAIAKHLRINNIILIFWLSIFFIPQQNFYAGEWVFGGFETKTIAYVFVFWSIWFLFKERFLPAVLFAIIAIYWHMLVGGWYTLYVFIYLLIILGLQKKNVIYWTYAGLILLPFVTYIYFGLVSGNENIIHGVNIGQLYAYIRNPHHIGLLKSWDYFYPRHAGKVAMACAAFIIAVVVYRKKLPTRFKWINTFILIILAQNLLFLLVALFDKNGFVAKFYPWRGSTLAMFFFQMATLLMFRHLWIPKLYQLMKQRFPLFGRKSFYSIQLGLFLAITLTTLGFKVDDRFAEARINHPGWVEVNALASKLKEVSKTGDMFMLLGDETLYTVAIPRKAERDIYYLFRCIPSQTQAIYEWYCRGLEQDKVKADTDYLRKSGLDKKIGFIVSATDLNASFLELTYKSDNYRIYKIIQ